MAPHDPTDSAECSGCILCMDGCVIRTSARAGAGTLLVRVPLNRANVRVTRAAVHRIQLEYSTEVSAPAPAFPSPPAASTQCKQPKRLLKTICQPGGPLDRIRDNVTDSVTNAFVLRRASRSWLFRQSVAIRGLPQDMAVPSRCPRRESPEKMKIKKTDVSYDFSRITISKRKRTIQRIPESH